MSFQSPLTDQQRQQLQAISNDRTAAFTASLAALGYTLGLLTLEDCEVQTMRVEAAQTPEDCVRAILRTYRLLLQRTEATIRDCGPAAEGVGGSDHRGRRP